MSVSRVKVRSRDRVKRIVFFTVSRATGKLLFWVRVKVQIELELEIVLNKEIYCKMIDGKEA